MKRQEAIDCLTSIKKIWEIRREEEDWARILIDDSDIGALNMAISDMQKIIMLENLTETHKQSGHAPTRTISMEDLRGLLNDTER